MEPAVARTAQRFRSSTAFGVAALDRAVYRSVGLLPMQYCGPLMHCTSRRLCVLMPLRPFTYDRWLGEAARSVGLQVIAPGA